MANSEQVLRGEWLQLLRTNSGAESLHSVLADTVSRGAETSVILTLLEDLVDVAGPIHADLVCGFLENNQAVLLSGLDATKGKGLIFLRLVNELIRRTDKHQHASICGRLYILLSKSFPAFDRSSTDVSLPFLGLNLRGDVNLDAAEHRFVPQPHLIMGKLQYFLYNIRSLKSAREWSEFKSVPSIALHPLDRGRHFPKAFEFFIASVE